ATLLFAMIYKILPDLDLAWRDVWIGAFLTAVLFTLGKYLLGLYLGSSGMGTPYGAAGSLAVFLIWIYYSAQIFFFGAEFTQVYAKQSGSQIAPDADAVSMETDAFPAGKAAKRRREEPPPPPRKVVYISTSPRRSVNGVVAV